MIALLLGSVSASALVGGGGTEPITMYSVNRLTTMRAPTERVTMYSVNRLTTFRLPFKRLTMYSVNRLTVFRIT